MNIETYYGMDMNPFRKDISIHKLYESNDYRQMTNRLDFLIRCKGIGLFIGNPGTGKTTCIRSLLDGLNTSRYKVVYICLTTITPLEFYRTLNDELGLEESHKKNILFRQIQSELERLSKEHMEVVIVIDEAQFLSEMVLKEFIMLFNFHYDSADYCTVILTGQMEFIRKMRLRSLEPFKQRTNINYTMTGFIEDEIGGYIKDRLKMVHCREDLFAEESYHTLFTLMRGSLRILNLLISRSLIIGMNRQAEQITSEIIKDASEEISIE